MEHDPQTVAENMIAIRGKAEALNRCDRYIAGEIRSENTKEFWHRVRQLIEERS